MTFTNLRTITLISWAFCALACSAGGGSGTGGVDGGAEPADGSVATPADGGAGNDARLPPVGEPDAAPDLEAQYKELPVSGGGDAPTVGAMTIKCATKPSDLYPAQASSGSTYPAAFVEIVSVTDPQGVTDVDGPSQQLVLFPSLAGTTPESHQFDIESYGIYFGGSNAQGYFGGPSGQAIRDTWCSQPWWPGEIVITDETGHVTKAKIRVPVVK